VKNLFTYLGFNFDTVLPRCPGCRQIFIQEELAKGKNFEIKLILEDKNACLGKHLGEIENAP